MPTELTGAVFTALMWQLIQDNIDNGIVIQLGCRVYNSATRNLSTNNLAALLWDTNLTDTDGMHSTTSNTSRIYANWTGWYHIQATVAWDTSGGSTGYRQLQILLNGVTTIATAAATPASGGACQMSVSCDRYFTAGDYVEIMAYQNSGVTLAIAPTSEYTPICSMVRI
jgi:hypothetical protein